MNLLVDSVHCGLILNGSQCNTADLKVYLPIKDKTDKSNISYASTHCIR